MQPHDGKRIGADALFRTGHLTVGLVLPVRDCAGAIDFIEQVALAELADELGFDALWVRDVPLNGRWYPETIGHLDPWVALGAISARTGRIALGTAATVLPLRHPLHIAKAATSLQSLSNGRMVLGLGSGDRREEYAAFGRAFPDRRRIHEEAWEQLAAALRSPGHITVGEAVFEMRPAVAMPPALIAIGGGGQTLEWVARHAAGWATYHREPAIQRDRHALWRTAVARAAPDEFRSFSVAVKVELDDSAVDPVAVELGYRTGLDGLMTIFEEQQKLGVHHLMLNLMTGRAPLRDGVRKVAEAIARSK